MRLFKHLTFILVAVLSVMSASAVEPLSKSNNMKAIIVYFSHSGNTALAAQEIQKVTGAEIVRIHPSQPYTAADLDWENEQSRCTQEHLHPDMRPGIKPLGADFSKYEVVFIGFPIWWHEEPAVIKTFIESTDLKGKELYPFCTSYESPMKEADEALQKAYPDLKWHTGLRLPASSEAIKAWIGQ